MRRIILSLSILAMLAACAKKTLPEGNVKGLARFQLGGGAAVSQAGIDEYNPYVLQLGDNYLLLVFASNRACAGCSGHNIFIARSTTPYNNDAVFPAFESPTVMTVASTPLNYTSPIAFAPVLSGNNVRIYLTNGTTIQQTGAMTPGASYDTTLSAITNTAGATNATVLGAEFTGSTIYAQQNGTVYSFAPNTSNTPVAMATGQNATSVASVDGAFTSRYDGFFSLIDGTITSMSLYGDGGRLTAVNTAITKAGIGARFLSVMRGGGFKGDLMFISGIEPGSATQDLYVVDGLNVWQMWQQIDPKPPEAPGSGTSGGGSTVADPAFSPVAGHYATPISVTMTSATSGATICYTTDGFTTPACSASATCSTGTTYSTAVSVTYTTTNFKALACKAGLTDSAVVAATHVSDATQPTLPGSQTATAISSSRIDLAWALSTDNATPQAQLVYEICQSTSVSGCSSFATISYTTAANATSYSVTGLSTTTQYYFRVRSKDLAGNTSPYGTQTTATTLGSGNTWHTFAGASGTSEFSNSVALLNDGNYVAVGPAYGGVANLGGQAALNAFAGVSDYWIIKYSTNGSVIWHTFAGVASSSETANSVAKTSDGGFIVAGSAGANVPSLGGQAPIVAYPGGTAIWIIKYTSAGAVQWHTFSGASVSADVSGILQANDGGYTLVGKSSNNVASLGGQAPLNAHTLGGNDDVWIIKYNSSGVVQWHTFAGANPGFQTGSSIAQTTDNGYAIAAQASANVSTLGGQSPLNAFAAGGGNNYWLIKYNSSGTVQWHTFAGSSFGNYNINSVAATSDGGCIVTGFGSANVASLGGQTPLNAYTSSVNYWTIKYSNTGAVEWHTFAGSSGGQFARAVIQTSDGGYAVAGDSSANVSSISSISPLNAYASGNDFWVVKYSSAGAVQWHTFLGGSGGQQPKGILQNGAGRFVIAGSSDANISSLAGLSPLNAFTSSTDFWVAQINSDGSIP
ncbi:MAG: chitobiase/beta-hexosaminidase C-terminal domain-containing protein [Turneriella sp.]|nr:chitobiase/beta-hexosaminidase C-terminal domain-containing protein [Turneriella sp.]